MMADEENVVATLLNKSKDSPAYNIIAKAIREYFQGDEEKMRVPWSRQMAEIIDSGFLDGILAQSEELIRRNNRLAAEKEREYKNIRRAEECSRYSLEQLQNQIRQANENLQKLNDAIKNTEEPDKLLASAERAYTWMLLQTGDKQLASKAFNSYLIGQNKDHDEYKPPTGEEDERFALKPREGR